MFQHILVPLDLDEPEFAALTLHAASIQAQDPQASLYLLSVLPGFGSPSVAGYFQRFDFYSLIQELQQKLTTLVEAHLPAPLQAKIKRQCVVEGTPHKEILAAAAKWPIDLIVMSSHNQDAMERFFLGSVAARTLERAHTSVLVIRH